MTTVGSVATLVLQLCAEATCNMVRLVFDARVGPGLLLPVPPVVVPQHPRVVGDTYGHY
jgi:hypothetical protein